MFREIKAELRYHLPVPIPQSLAKVGEIDIHTRLPHRKNTTRWNLHRGHSPLGINFAKRISRRSILTPSTIRHPFGTGRPEPIRWKRHSLPTGYSRQDWCMLRVQFRHLVFFLLHRLLFPGPGISFQTIATMEYEGWGRLSIVARFLVLQYSIFRSSTDLVSMLSNNCQIPPSKFPPSANYIDTAIPAGAIPWRTLGFGWS